MKKIWFSRLQRAAYILIVFLLGIFLFQQGIKPWQTLLEHCPAFLSVMLVTAAGTVVQAGAFRACLPRGVVRPQWLPLIRIWVYAGLTSFLAPLIAGLAVRTVLLQRQGLKLKPIALATLKQTLVNLECALMTASLVLIFYPWPDAVWAGWILGLVWGIWWMIKQILIRVDLKLISAYFPSLRGLLKISSWGEQPWLWGQLMLMTLNYWSAFFLFGIPLTWHESLLLTALTLLMSITVIIPNGMGVLDVLWVWVANKQGFALNESVGLALCFRFGFLASVFLLWLSLKLLPSNLKPIAG